MARNRNKGKNRRAKDSHTPFTEFRIIGEAPDMRIIYDENKPEFIDKSGNEDRDKNLRINDEEEDGGGPDSDIRPGSRVGGE